jgi:thiopeptide-type bacteriocin biosynthesis protein
MKPPCGRKALQAASLYEPLDFFVVRAPLLPLDTYRALSGPAPGAAAGLPEANPARLLAFDDRVRRALAVGSLSLLDALARGGDDTSRTRKTDIKLLRYLIRMATRPTPFGLFAGVALGQWGERTDLQIGSGSFRQRTRPDMAWLMRLVMQVEAIPEVRRQLRLVANPAAFIHAGRVFLAERVASGKPSAPPAVSIRATGVVRRALAESRDPLPYAELASLLLENTPGATAEQVERLLMQLWEQTLLLTDLRPPLTVESPARYVVERLAGISAADGIRARIESTLATAAAWDASPSSNGEEGYRAMVGAAGKAGPFDRSPFQVDAGLDLRGRAIGHAVGEEVARMAELLLRMSPLPRGPAHLSAYRRLFEQRYGLHREVPVLELLDPNFGLGPPSPYGVQPPSIGRVSQTASSRRNNALTDLALAALRDRTLAVELEEPALKRLETWEPPATVPYSLDLLVSIAAASPQALDAGEFRVVLGPNVGAMAAGRTLGRFTDLLGGARDALERVARAEERHAPQKLWAELVYQPRFFRLANVSIRPNLRAYEIALGVASGEGTARRLPLDELVVGIRGGNFYVRWPGANRDVVVTAGHMLNYVRAPAVCRFLAEASRDGCCHLTGFNWGPAWHFPFLPRIQVGRSVLALAQWRLRASAAGELSASQPDVFREALARWRARWDVPRHVYLTSGDNRLLLDLSAPEQADELRRAISQLRGDGSVVLNEVLPDLDHAWVRDSDNRPFVTELVVPLVLRPGGEIAPPIDDAGPPEHGSDEVPSCVDHLNAASPAARLHPPGSEWLFVKLYGPRDLESDLIAGPIRSFAAEAIASGMAASWFFVRYADPERHLRLRFRGRPQRLMQELLPAVCTWATTLIDEGLCRRFAFDTYEQEIERYGGCNGIAIAEDLFAADSRAVAELLHLLQSQTPTHDHVTLAVLTVDAILEGMGLDAKARAEWCRGQAIARQVTGAEYRRRKDVLRAVLFGRDDKRREPDGAAVAEILADLLNSVSNVNKRYVALASDGGLGRPPSALCQSFAHLHLNRLLGADSLTERRILGLLGRTREGLQRAPVRAP